MVNTFWTSEDPRETARALDDKRLMKQVVEVVQISNVLQDIAYLCDYYSIEYLIGNIPELRKKYLEDEFVLRCKKYTQEYEIVPKSDYSSSQAKADQASGSRFRVSKAGYWSHPATLMWFYHSDALYSYSNTCREEFIRRGGSIIIPSFSLPESFSWPQWIRSRRVIKSHRRSLLRKFPEHYGKYFREKKEFTDYYWPLDIRGW